MIENIVWTSNPKIKHDLNLKTGCKIRPMKATYSGKDPDTPELSYFKKVFYDPARFQNYLRNARILQGMDFNVSEIIQIGVDDGNNYVIEKAGFGMSLEDYLKSDADKKFKQEAARMLGAEIRKVDKNPYEVLDDKTIKILSDLEYHPEFIYKSMLQSKLPEVIKRNLKKVLKNDFKSPEKNFLVLQDMNLGNFYVNTPPEREEPKYLQYIDLDWLSLSSQEGGSYVYADQCLRISGQDELIPFLNEGYQISGNEINKNNKIGWMHNLFSNLRRNKDLDFIQELDDLSNWFNSLQVSSMCLTKEGRKLPELSRALEGAPWLVKEVLCEVIIPGIIQDLGVNHTFASDDKRIHIGNYTQAISKEQAESLEAEGISKEYLLRTKEGFGINVLSMEYSSKKPVSSFNKKVMEAKRLLPNIKEDLLEGFSIGVTGREEWTLWPSSFNPSLEMMFNSFLNASQGKGMIGPYKIRKSKYEELCRIFSIIPEGEPTTIILEPEWTQVNFPTDIYYVNEFQKKINSLNNRLNNQLRSWQLPYNERSYGIPVINIKKLERLLKKEFENNGFKNLLVSDALSRPRKNIKILSDSISSTAEIAKDHDNYYLRASEKEIDLGVYENKTPIQKLFRKIASESIRQNFDKAGTDHEAWGDTVIDELFIGEK